MKKPVLLLVDDDAEVLAALEACLRPEFEQVCRVEAFDDPLLVARAVSAWEEEQRPLAVAVVDQRMPGINGVDLLARLNRSPIAIHMKAMLLTGYGGLDSVLAAKNESGVDGYHEKPWETRRLVANVRALLCDHMTESGADSYFVVREACSIDELQVLFRKRYSVYQRSEQANVCPPNPDHVAIDVFDLYAYHLGVHRHVHSGEETVGCIRLVGQEHGPSSREILDLADGFPSQLPGLSVPPSAPLPVLTYHPDREAIEWRLREFESRGESLMEAGRFALDPAARSLGTVRHVIESAVAFFLHYGFHHAILTCLPAHERLYAHLGFAPMPGTEIRYIPNVGATLRCLIASARAIPSPARERVSVLAARHGRTGDMCYCATFPACLPGPYETGDFAAVDLFCPFRATELLAGGRSQRGAGPFTAG